MGFLIVALVLAVAGALLIYFVRARRQARLPPPAIVVDQGWPSTLPPSPITITEQPDIEPEEFQVPEKISIIEPVWEDTQYEIDAAARREEEQRIEEAGRREEEAIAAAARAEQERILADMKLSEAELSDIFGTRDPLDLAGAITLDFTLDPTPTATPTAPTAPLEEHADSMARLEAARQEAERQEAARQEAARQEAARQEAARQEAARQEAARQEAARQETERQEADRQEAARQEAARQEAERRAAFEAARQEAARQQADAAARAEAARQAALEAKRQAALDARRQAADRVAAEREARLAAERAAAAEVARIESDRLAAVEAKWIAGAALRQAELDKERLAQEEARQAAARRFAALAAEGREPAPNAAPVVPAGPASAAAATPPPRTQKSAAATLVMLVDDSKVVRVKTSRLLGARHYQVLLATDGRDAVFQIADRLPDIVITDAEMPRMDGFELARHLRANPLTAHIPVIMISAEERDSSEPAEAGVDVVLGKPYADDVLISHIERLVREGRGSM